MPLALPLIFEGVKLFAGLFDEGKKVYEAVTGAPSAAATVEELGAEVAAMPADQQAAFADAMSAKLKMYQAETDRLRVQSGEVTAEILGALPPEAAAEVAHYRMTTRPWTVRQMVQVIKLPFWILCVDGVLALINSVTTWLFALAAAEREAPQLAYLAATFFSADNVYLSMYAAAVKPAAAIVLGYMTLREVGKARGQGDGPSVSDLVGKVKGFVDKIRG